MEAIAARFGIPTVHREAEAMLTTERLGFVDIIADVDTHQHFVALAAAHRVAAICQRPMAPDLATAEAMVRTFRETGVPFVVHGNWRWRRWSGEVRGDDSGNDTDRAGAD